MRIHQFASVAATILLMGLLASPAQAADDAPNSDQQPAEHCVASATPEGESNITAAPLCFATFAEAVAEATDGTLQLPGSSREVSQAQLDEARTRADASSLSQESALASTVIGIEYDSANGGGSSLVVSVSGATCSAGGRYTYASMPSGWNNRVSSAYTYAGCKSRHHQYVNFAGASYLCGCAGMGAMDNLTSSIRWSSTGS